MKVVTQDGIKDCGICCLLSIIRYYGGDVSKEYLREITYTTKDGVTLYNLIEGAKIIGFNAEGLKGKIENINVNNLPCIAHLIINKSYKHFIVIYQINYKKKELIIMDPAKGKKTLSFSEFNLLSSGNYLFLKPIKKLPIITKKNIIYKNIKNIIISSKKIVITITILTIVFFITNILTSLYFKYIIEYSINYNLTENIKIITITVLILYLLKNINELIRNNLINKWNSLLDFETSTTTYKQILHLPYLYFKNRTTGEIISRFKDLNTIRTYLSNFFSTIVTDVISTIIFELLMYKYNKKLTLILLIPIIVLLIYTLIINKYKRRLLKKVTKSEDIINSYIIQGISNVDTIKGSHLEKRLTDKYTYTYKSFLESIYKYLKFNSIDYFIKNNINDLISIILYSIGAISVINKKLSLSNLIIFQTFLTYSTTSFYRIINIISEYHSYYISKERVEELYLINKENFKNNYFYLPYTLDGEIIIKNLSYKVGSRILFNNINLKINKGEKILLTGESGCGKTTLVKMLLRYVETNFDTIKIANIDINHYHLENIRSNITFITNNEYLFTDTIKNNICLYKEYSEEEITNSIKLCLVDEIIKKNNLTLETLVEENGFNFSNGEKQRIILSRAILRKTNIYIFDEALSQIDIDREGKILKNIFKYLEDKTIIVISHRFNNKKLFDRILKLENGVIIEK